jgi:branched-chain amino acid transport system ATP-binding protein
MSALLVRDVSLRFGGLQALSNVSLAVEPGERRIIIGPNGAGKTTLFNCIAGTIPPTSGSIALFGRDVTRASIHERARLGIARTFQITNLFGELTVQENAELAVAAGQRVGIVLHRPMTSYRRCGERVDELLQQWRLADRARTPVRDLSYGEKRQVDLMLALAGTPSLLLLDEPLSGLSTAESAHVVEIVRGLPRSITIVMIEHDMDVAFSLADRISVLHLGQLVTEGPPDAVRLHPRVNEIYLGSEEASC